ncbi:MAG TPA: ATP-dependent helicase, partial [bacterium]|nr:ATP-dependent helicase [bacterium]
ADEYDTVNNFIKYIDLKQKAGENPRQGEIEGVEDDAVRVLTIHKAKGLEFKAVFVPALVQDKFPARNRASSPFPLPEPLMKDIVDEAVYAKEEERRLFYVAMTRARDALYLTCSRRYEGVSERKPSIFLFEAGLAVPDKGAEAGQSPAGIESFERKEAAPKKSGRPVKSGAVRLSNYQIDDYLTCPFKYRLIHILKMPIREQPNIIYGQAMHRVAAEYYRAKQENTPVSVDGLIKIFDALWKPRGFISREHEKKRYEAALRNIENFFIVEEKRGKVPKYIEKSFEFKLNENIVIAGRWDRIDEEDGKPMIVDYKTSDVRDMEKAKKKLSSPDIARQLTLYALAYERVFGVPVDSVAVYFFESALLAVKKIKPDTITRFMEKAEKVAEGIKNGCFDAVPGPISCRYCAFNTICPHSKADVLF